MIKGNRRNQSNLSVENLNLSNQKRRNQDTDDEVINWGNNNNDDEMQLEEIEDL